MKSACVDFDAVIHVYPKWGGNPPPNPPIEGAEVGLRALREAGYRVVVLSARDPFHVRAWLEKHGLISLVADVTNVKPPAAVYFDDRAWRVPANKPNGLVEAVRDWLAAEAMEGVKYSPAVSESLLSKAPAKGPEERLG